MSESPSLPQLAQIDSFDDRIEALTCELGLSIRWNRPCVLFAVHHSEYIREDAEIALENYLIGQDQRVMRLPMGLEKENANILFMLGLHSTASNIFFMNGSEGTLENRTRIYSCLERHHDILLSKNIRIVFWLTQNESIHLAHCAPDLWTNRQRMIEFVDAPRPEQILNNAIESAWQGTGEYTDEFEDTEKKITLHESFLMELPENQESTSTRAQLLITLGILNWRKGDFEKAEELFQLALEAAYTMEDSWFEAECFNAIALVKTSQGKHNEAIEAYKQAIRCAPDQIFAWNNLGNLCLKIMRSDEAMIAFQKALEQNQEDSVAWNGLGNVYYKIGYVDDAITAYRKAIEHAPGLALPWNGLGDAYASVGRDVDAIMAFQKAIELNRNFQTPWLRLANMYSIQNRNRDAIKAYQRALQIDQKNSAVWNELGMLHLKGRADQEAVSAFSRAIELDRGFGQAYVNLALAYTNLGKNVEAINLCIRSIDLLTEDIEKAASWNHLANFYRNVDDYEKAIQAYQMADKLNGRLKTNLPKTTPQPVPIVNLEEEVSVQNRSVNSDLADSFFQTAPGVETESTYPDNEIPENEEIMKESNNPIVWNEKGNIHYQNGDYEEAINSYNKAIELDRSFGWPYSNLALTYLTMGKLAEAVLLYRKSAELLKSNKEKASVWDNLGNIYRHLDDYENVILAYQKADELDPETAGRHEKMEVSRIEQDSHTAQTWLELGNLFFKAGAYGDAVNAYKKALDMDGKSGWAYSNMAMSLVFLGKYKDAVPLYLSSIDLFDNDKDKAVAWNRLGNLYRKMNDYDNAMAAYKNASNLSNEKASLLERARFSLLSNCYVN